MKIEILLNTVKADLSNGTDNSPDILRGQFPSLTMDECCQISESIKAALTNDTKDKVSLAVTAPPSFGIDAKPTMTVVQSMLAEANKSILITGYSLSSYFSELLDTIINKSQRGVFVKFFINNIEEQKNVEKLLRYRGHFLKIYNYCNDNDKRSALHAKVISVDMTKTLITSANLSYHGQQGNIELGTVIESSNIARQVDEIMTQLIFNKIFIEV